MRSRQFIWVLLVGFIVSLVNPTHQDSPGGDDDFSGDDGSADIDVEGSAEVEAVNVTTRKVAVMTTTAEDLLQTLSLCERQRLEAIGKNQIDAFRPECTADGKFKAMQCHSSTGKCWCVNREDGQRIAGTMAQGRKPNCEETRDSSPKIVVATRRPAPGAQPDTSLEKTEKETTPELFFETDGVTETRTVKTTRMPSEVTNREKTTSSAMFIFKDPLILAGIICGAVLAIICIVMIVMFTIYRMRKKDEGSYALDPPKKSHAFGYTRARDQEFFA